MRRRSLAIVGMALLLVLAAAAQGGPNTKFEKTVDLAAGGRLTLETFKGSIELTSWNQNKVEIVARIEPGDDVSSEYAQRSVEATEIDVWGSGRSLSIRSNYEDVPCREDADRGWGLGNCSKTLPYVHYQIKAPHNLSIRLEDHKSEIDISGFDGDLDLDTHKGTVKLTDLTGEIRLDTHKGRVEASGLSGDIRLNTLRGRIRLAGLRGRVRVETHRGEVSIDALEIDGSSRLETHRGHIVLSLPESQGFDVRGEIGRRGAFDSDFDITLRTFGRRERNRDRIEGTINGGGPEIYINTYRGEIRLRRR